MLKKIDILGFIAALLAIAGVLSGNDLLPPWLKFIGGELFWFFGVVLAIIWIVFRVYLTRPSAPN